MLIMAIVIETRPTPRLLYAAPRIYSGAAPVLKCIRMRRLKGHTCKIRDKEAGYIGNIHDKYVFKKDKHEDNLNLCI